MPLTLVHYPRSTEPRKRAVALMIEDNLTQLDLYTMVLEEKLDVMTATRGEAGYGLACREHPDVIVLDVLLPDVDGLTVCEWLQSNPVTASIPLIVLTGDDGAYGRAHAEGSRFAAVLTKPCSADRLLAAIRSALDPREAAGIP